MPLRLNVGLTKKIGQPDYGSLGASCSVEVELDNSLLAGDLDAFHRQVRSAYIACAQAVNDELARYTANGKHASQPQPPQSIVAEGAISTPRSGNGHSPAHANGNGGANHRATHKQLDYARQLAGQIPGLGIRRLEDLANQMFAKPLADLTSLEASGLIDVLKDIKAGKIALDSVIQGAPS